MVAIASVEHVEFDDNHGYFKYGTDKTSDSWLFQQRQPNRTKQRKT